MIKSVLVFLIGVAVLIGQDHAYVGVNKCKSCHKKAEKGAQYKVWKDGPHAHAFETLKTPEAQKVAQDRGLKTSADKSPECVVCHTTGFGKGGYEIKDEAFWAQVTDKGKPTKEVKRMAGLESIGCEVCHGAGNDYKKKKTMIGISDGSIDGVALGLIEPNEETCLACHNTDSPSFTEFNFEERYKEIAHPRPEKK